jgi:hypothetical protein
MNVSRPPTTSETHHGFSIDPLTVVALLRALADQIESKTCHPTAVKQTTDNTQEEFVMRTISVTFHGPE